MDEKPLILVTNDDSITAKGIASLVKAVEGLGEIVVVAPDKPQSGMGHAITIHDPLRLKKSDVFPGIESYTCSGTPVDCVKIAIYEVLKKTSIYYCFWSKSRIKCGYQRFVLRYHVGSC